jgi:hypothetical protein
MSDAKEPVIDPIDAFVFMFSDDLRKFDPDGVISAGIARKVHQALSAQEVIFLDQACQEALKNYQRKLGSSR